MPTQTRKLLKNQTIEVAVHVTNKRLQNAGVKIDADLGVTKQRQTERTITIPETVTRHLVGRG